MRYWLFILVAACLLLAGCVSVGESQEGSLPWSTPQSWEGQTIGIPIN